MSKLIKVDEALVKEVRDSVKFVASRESSRLDHQTAAALSNYQPATHALLPGGVGFVQGGYIGSILLPEVVAAPDGSEQASYAVFGKEAFYAGDDVVGLYEEPKATDLAVTWTAITLDVHAKKATIDDREAAAAAAVGMDIAAEKTKIALGQLQARKENRQATLLVTSGNYLSSSHYATLSGTTQWSHASSTPISVISGKIEYVRSVTGTRPNYFWLSPTAFNALRFHASVLDVIKYSGQKNAPGAPASIETIAALFGINVVVGEAVQTTTVGGALADTWNDCAGLLHVGGNGMYDTKFGSTLVSAGYPKQRVERNPFKGANGSDEIIVSDAYKAVVQLSSAGYLWLDVTA